MSNSSQQLFEDKITSIRFRTFSSNSQPRMEFLRCNEAPACCTCVVVLPSYIGNTNSIWSFEVKYLNLLEQNISTSQEELKLR
ncbi:hypothetical protein pdam_00022823 [Pocillopora damicornis]|uniref:Uncharacterized protein n=1 Tax=Pocillopora damicornis TaxID=46731 RepID=A0A3M6TIW5_POCDA|nr:hypothetical protein pdam_00022823 [Pocillopora damicornis]